LFSPTVDQMGELVRLRPIGKTFSSFEPDKANVDIGKPHRLHVNFALGAISEESLVLNRVGMDWHPGDFSTFVAVLRNHW